MAIQTVTKSIDINAPKEKIWEIIVDPELYTQWVSGFSEGLNEGSSYKGSWDEGSDISFVDKSGSGLFAKVVENRKYEFIKIEYGGWVVNSIPDHDSSESKTWKGLTESYTLIEQGGVTTFTLDIQLPDDFVESMSQGWDAVLAEMKKVAEKGN